MIAVGIERLDDLRNLRGMEPLACKFFETPGQFRTVDGAVAVRINGIKQLFDVHALTGKELLEVVKSFGHGPFFVGHTLCTGGYNKTVPMDWVEK